MLNLAAVPRQINFFQRWNTMVPHSSLTSPPTNVPPSYRPRLSWLHLLQPGCCWHCSFWPHSHHHWNPPPLLHIVGLHHHHLDVSLAASTMDSQISPRFPCWCCLTLQFDPSSAPPIPLSHFCSLTKFVRHLIFCLSVCVPVVPAPGCVWTVQCLFPSGSRGQAVCHPRHASRCLPDCLGVETQSRH